MNFNVLKLYYFVALCALQPSALRRMCFNSQELENFHLFVNGYQMLVKIEAKFHVLIGKGQYLFGIVHVSLYFQK